MTSYYTDIGKDKINNRAMLNICVTFAFPALPDLVFDLVIATKSFKSALIDAAENIDVVDLDDIANDVFRKNGRHIRATFMETLRGFGIQTTGDYYIVADRASVNVSGFGRHFMCCFPHQLDLAFKCALNEMRENHSTSDLITSLDAVHELTTFCKRRDIEFLTEASDGKRQFWTSPSNPAKTRWLGLLKQVTQYIKCKADVENKARDIQEMSVITQKINWQLLESWINCCGSLKSAMLHGQQVLKPNLHHCILDLMVMLSELGVIASRKLDELTEDISMWARYELLGLCHKALRVLDIPHFCACLFNPGVGYIPDINEFLPWSQV